MNVDYSIVIPVYNSEAVVAETVAQTVDVCRSNRFSFEIILVNDGSTDGSWNAVRECVKSYREVSAVDLLRNYGQHNANMCGFRQARGAYIITMDDDLQNPPSEIPKLIKKAMEGYDLVIGKFASKKHPLFRRIGSRLIAIINRRIFKVPDGVVLTNFRIIKRSVVERVCDYRSGYPYVPGLVVMFSRDIANVDVLHAPRKVGSSNYSILKILELVAVILFSYSSYPLRVVSQLGLWLSVLSFVVGTFYLVKALIWGTTVPGWATIVVLLSMFCAIIMAMLGMIGEYMVRLINQTSFPESYVVRDIVN